MQKCCSWRPALVRSEIKPFKAMSWIRRVVTVPKMFLTQSFVCLWLSVNVLWWFVPVPSLSSARPAPRLSSPCLACVCV